MSDNSGGEDEAAVDNWKITQRKMSQEKDHGGRRKMSQEKDSSPQKISQEKDHGRRKIHD